MQQRSTDRSVRLLFPPRVKGTVWLSFFFKDLFNYVVVFGITTVKGEKQTVIKKIILNSSCMRFLDFERDPSMREYRFTTQSCGEKER